MGDAPRQVKQLEALAYRQARAMRVLPGVAIALGVWVLACSVGLWRGRRVFGLGIVPAVVLCALLLGGSVGECVAWLCALGVTAVVGIRFVGAGRTVTLLCALIVCVLTADLASGNMLMRRSVLGYSAVEGARYYGIGNEAMGLLVGAAVCLGWAVWASAKSAWARGAVCAGLTAIVVLLALPSFGAKAGSVFVAVPSFGVLLWVLGGRRGGRWLVPMLALLTLCTMAGVVLLDRHSGVGQSHVGQAAARIGQQGTGQAWDIVARKARVEGRLLTHSAWAAALWGTAVGLVSIARRRLQEKHRSALLTAGAVAGAACVLFNDAGTVAGALCLTMVWSMTAAQTQQ